VCNRFGNIYQVDTVINRGFGQGAGDTLPLFRGHLTKHIDDVPNREQSADNAEADIRRSAGYDNALFLCWGIPAFEWL